MMTGETWILLLKEYRTVDVTTQRLQMILRDYLIRINQEPTPGKPSSGSCNIMIPIRDLSGDRFYLSIRDKPIRKPTRYFEIAVIYHVELPSDLYPLGISNIQVTIAKEYTEEDYSKKADEDLMNITLIDAFNIINPKK